MHREQNKCHPGRLSSSDTVISCPSQPTFNRNPRAPSTALPAAGNNPHQLYQQLCTGRSVLSRTVPSTVPRPPHNSGILPTPAERHLPSHIVEADIKVKSIKKSVKDRYPVSPAANTGITGQIKAETTDIVCVHLCAHADTLMSLTMKDMVLFLFHTWV